MGLSEEIRSAKIVQCPEVLGIQCCLEQVFKGNECGIT